MLRRCARVASGGAQDPLRAVVRDRGGKDGDESGSGARRRTHELDLPGKRHLPRVVGARVGRFHAPGLSFLSFSLLFFLFFSFVFVRRSGPRGREPGGAAANSEAMPKEACVGSSLLSSDRWTSLCLLFSVVTEASHVRVPFALAWACAGGMLHCGRHGCGRLGARVLQVIRRRRLIFFVHFFLNERRRSLGRWGV